MPTPTLFDLRRYAIAQTLGKPTTLPRAIARLGFVQADPIRAPARAQDLTLRHRVVDYKAGDLEQRYSRLKIEEDFLINYGFVPREVQALMHPRTPRTVWPEERWQQAHEVLEFVRKRRIVHPREVDEHFAHGKVQNWFGGSSNASTQLLDGMHYRGLLRVARREGGIRLYAAREQTPEPADEQAAMAAMDALVDLVVRKYAPLPAASLGQLLSHLGGGAPQWRTDRGSALKRARERLASAVIEGTTWYWPTDQNPRSRKHQVDDTVRLLAPFDPIVWDRRRFELFWGWAYRFEAYTPAPQRVRGYYALPLLWRDEVIGWANVGVKAGQLQPDLGFVNQRPRDPFFNAALDEELQRMTVFLGLQGP